MQNTGTTTQVAEQAQSTEERPTTGIERLDKYLDQMHDAGRVAMLSLLATREQKTPASLHDKIERRLRASVEGVVDSEALQDRLEDGTDAPEAAEILWWLKLRDNCQDEDAEDQKTKEILALAGVLRGCSLEQVTLLRETLQAVIANAADLAEDQDEDDATEQEQQQATERPVPARSLRRSSRILSLGI